MVVQNNHGMTNPGQEEFGFASYSWDIVSRYDTLLFRAFPFSLSFQTTSIGAYTLLMLNGLHFFHVIFVNAQLKSTEINMNRQ